MLLELWGIKYFLSTGFAKLKGSKGGATVGPFSTMS